MIKSPNKYSPIKHKENALKRRNIVLYEMEKDGKISLSEAIKSKSESINLKITENKENGLNTYSEQAIDEAIKILGMPAKHIANGGYKIYTYQDPNIQNNLLSSFEKVDFSNNDFAGYVINNNTYGVSGYLGKSAYKILENKTHKKPEITGFFVCFGGWLHINIYKQKNTLWNTHLF